MSGNLGLSYTIPQFKVFLDFLLYLFLVVLAFDMLDEKLFADDLVLLFYFLQLTFV